MAEPIGSLLSWAPKWVFFGRPGARDHDELTVLPSELVDHGGGRREGRDRGSSEPPVEADGVHVGDGDRLCLADAAEAAEILLELVARDAAGYSSVTSCAWALTTAAAVVASATFCVAMSDTRA